MDELITESYRIGFIIIIPLLAVSVAISIVTSVLQSAIRSQDTIIGYGVKLIAICMLISFIFTAAAPMLQQLVVICIKHI